MANEKFDPNEIPVEPCFRQDGSFDLGAFLRAPQVLGALVFIVLGLGICFLVTNVLKVESNFVCLMVMLLCSFACLSGAESISKYYNMQREARDAHMAKGKGKKKK